MYALKEYQWTSIKNLLPGRPGHVGVTAKDNRLFVEAVLYRHRTGIPWRELPPCFGDFRVVHLRYSRWRSSGVWLPVVEALTRDVDNPFRAIDATLMQPQRRRSRPAASLLVDPDIAPRMQRPGARSTTIAPVFSNERFFP
jgi:transposase